MIQKKRIEKLVNYCKAFFEKYNTEDIKHSLTEDQLKQILNIIEGEKI